MAADLLRAQQSALVKMVHHRDQFARQAGDTLGLCARRFGGGWATGRLFQLGQRAPAGFERGIEPCGTAEGRNCSGPVALRTGEMPCLLPCAPVFGHRRVQRRKVPFSLVEALEIARGDGGHVERFAVARILVHQRGSERHSFLEDACLQRLLRLRQSVVACRHCLRPLQIQTAEANPCSPPPSCFPVNRISSRSRPGNRPSADGWW